MFQTHSIIILTKDRPDLLPRAVRSALQAARPGGEVVVVDDASLMSASEVLLANRLESNTSLRVLRRCVSEGISAARNFGIAQSGGEVIFFLDDDDTMQPDYCERILSGPAATCDYGFSAYRLMRPDGGSQRPKPRFATGRIPPGAPLRRHLCGMGMGFWIRRTVADATGPFATEIVINEDTDYVCRLIRSRRQGWYSAEIGVDIYAHDDADNVANITGRVDARARAQAMLYVCRRHPSLVHYLGKSYLRHCAKAGMSREAAEFILRQQGLRSRVWLGAYFLGKRFIYRAVRRR